MGNFFLLIISSLAVFRLSELVAYDRGPFDIFKKIRDLFPEGSMIDQMLECIYCNGIWWSFILCVAYACMGIIPWVMGPVWNLGIAGGAIVVIRTVRKRE